MTALVDMHTLAANKLCAQQKDLVHTDVLFPPLGACAHFGACADHGEGVFRLRAWSEKKSGDVRPPCEKTYLHSDNHQNTTLTLEHNTTFGGNLINYSIENAVLATQRQ